MRNSPSPFPPFADLLDGQWHRYTTVSRAGRVATYRDGQRVATPPDEASA